MRYLSRSLAASLALSTALVSVPFEVKGPAVETATGALAAETQDNEGPVKWTCPMHPHYIADHFGPCPICGMDLVKLQTGPGNAEGTGAAEARAAITVAPEVMQTIGVRLAPAELSSFGRVIRSYGLVAENERLQTELTVRTEGWIEDLRIRAVGDQVKAGDLLFTIYAPEFVVTQRDYLDTLKTLNRTRIEAIKTRLRAFGMQERAIEQLEQTRQAMEFVPFYALREGTVAEIDLRPGTYVKRGTMLTRIQDYRQVWLLVQVSEKDLTFIKPGTPARVTFPNIPGREVFAKVEYVYPTVSTQTRTGQVRLVLENPDGQLRPGAYADVAFEVAAEQRLAVPSEAILRSGGARYVIASLGGGRFEPRAVKTGLTSGRWTEIEGEISTGDEIVVSGQFLIDSESALRESFRKLERLQLPLSLLQLTDTQYAMFDHFVDAALYMHEALIDGYDVEPKFLDPAIEAKAILWPAFQHTQLAFVMEEAVAKIEKAKRAQTVSEQQAALAALVSALSPWMRDGAPTHYAEKGVVMFRDTASGRSWVQMKGRALNPYSRGKSELMPWPENAQVSEVQGAPSGRDAKQPAKPMTGHRH
ncbi:MAG: efflux RND transporter periplasmic adaptor subunit [Pseudomonadota bacterium]